jgi:hypothetical protein
MKKIMTTTDFNEKYKEYLEEGHYGLDIGYPAVIMYLDDMFQGLVVIPGFKYSQIKLKFNMCRFYSNLPEIMPNFGGKIGNIIEKDINFMVRIEDEVYKRLKEKETENE